MGAKRDRDMILDSIAKTVQENRDEELGVVPQEEVDEVEETEKAKVETTENGHEESETTEDEVAESHQEEEFVTIKVDGKEEKIPLSKIKDAGIRTFQKETAADRRLQEVAEREKQLIDYTQRLMGMQQQPTAQAATAKQPDIPEDISRIVEAIQFGEKDEAAKALVDLVNYAKADKGPNTNDVLAVVDAQLKNYQMRQKLEAPPEQGGFGDITADPYLLQIASNQVDQVIQQRYAQTGQLQPATWEDYKQACENVRNWRNQFAPNKPEMNIEERVERKKNLDTVKSSSARAQPTPEKKPPTTRETIANMAKRRAS